MDREEFRTTLRTALMQLDDFQGLRKSPLLLVLCPASEAATPIALQTKLLNAIDALRNEPSVGNARYYDLLYYRFVEQLNQTEVAFQLGVSVRQLRRDQNNALEYLADRLWDEIVASHAELAGLDRSSRTATPQAPDSTAIDQELSWLSHDPRTEPVALFAELTKAVADMQVVAQHRNTTVDYHPPIEECFVPAAAPVVRQALLTVLSGAIAYAHGSRLLISAYRRAGQVVVTLGTTPAGRIGTADTVTTMLETTGRLLAPFGGTVEVSREGDGQVFVTLPTLASVPILLVDDNPDARQLFQRYVANSRFRLVTVEMPEQAIAAATSSQVRAAVLDVMMPGIDGWDLLSRWRHHPATQHIPVAVCTVLPQQELAHLLGAALFIQKPIDQETFLQALHALTA